MASQARLEEVGTARARCVEKALHYNPMEGVLSMPEPRGGRLGVECGVRSDSQSRDPAKRGPSLIPAPA